MSATPQRIQLRRTKGWSLQRESLALNGLPAVKVDRTTIWGNDFTVEDFGSVEECVALFEHDLLKFSSFHPDEFEAFIAPLRGRNVACWCKPGAVCHADVLLELAALDSLPKKEVGT